MEIPKYLENQLNLNSGIYISEKDYSLYNITQYYNRLSLVIGCSKNGPTNLPVLVVSPENFENIYGKQDFNLERRNSYFHRTVKDMLTESPVICLNLRLWDNTLDKYNWINISTSSNNKNSLVRNNSIQDFYNISDGFWKRSSDDFLDIVKNNITSYNTNPLNFVNQKEKAISVLLFKSNIKGFDISVEEWYNGKYPNYLHPKDFISDFMVEVIVVEGKWNNYEELSNSTIYSKYFNDTGLNKAYIEDFLNSGKVNLIKRWNVSLIPYFMDRNNNDMWIESVINKDVNETGLFCAYDTNILESESRNGLLDILGDNLTVSKEPEIDFLSYKRYLTDFFIVKETSLDSPNNTFGNHFVNKSGRTAMYAEGYINNVRMKKNILSTTSSLEIKPFDTDEDAYGIINGKLITIDSEISDFLALFNILVPNSHRAYVIVLTETGIKFRLGGLNDLSQNLFLPQINPEKEIVLAYYELIQDINGNFLSNFFPVTVDINGFINPFRVNNINEPKISFNTTTYDWIQEINFEDIKTLRYQDYKQLRIYHLWFWLSNNISNESLVLDINGYKQKVDWVEQGNTINDKWIRIAIKDRTSNIYNTSGTNGMTVYYIKDIELLTKNNKWTNQKPPLVFGTNGIIGDQSFIRTSYLNGNINSGDPFFSSLSEEENIRFFYDSNLNQNLIILSSNNYYKNKKIIVDGSIFNDGIFTLLDTINYGDYSAIVVQENVVDEESDLIGIYDATKPNIINLYDINNTTTALVEVWDGNPEELYKRLKRKDPNSVWKKTLQINSILQSNQIVVDWNMYHPYLEKGYFLLSDRKKITDYNSEIKRNWTRIIDLQRLNDNELLIITDSPILYKMVDSVMETDILKPIPLWVNTLDFKVLEGFKPREDSFPDGTDERMNNILNLVSENTKMFENITSDKFEWRYLIDSFGGYSNKYQLANLAYKKKFALSFINTPSIKSFKKDNTKYTTDGMFDTKKFISGGDRKMNTGTSYTLTDIGETHSVYLAPWVSVYENGRYNIVPPASHVAQIFMRKHNDTNKNAWNVIAGISDSRISSIRGLEVLFDNDELKDMNDFGITCLTNKDNILFYLSNERTAVKKDSVLRFIHNREALIELELSLYKGLREFQWNFITDNIKIEIEKSANNICEYYRLNNAIQNYTNAFVITNELIDAQIGLLETSVEMTGAMQTILLKISIMKTGAISILK